jgi:hypothetical protein
MSSKNNPSGKEKTYEEIGAKLNISPQQVHKIEKEAYNKIIGNIMVKQKMDVFDAVLYFSILFGAEPEQCYKKLNPANKLLLKEQRLQ